MKEEVKVERARGESEEGMGQICAREKSGRRGMSVLEIHPFDPALLFLASGVAGRMPPGELKTHLDMSVSAPPARPRNLERDHFGSKLGIAPLQRLLVALDLL